MKFFRKNTKSQKESVDRCHDKFADETIKHAKTARDEILKTVNGAMATLNGEDLWLTIRKGR